MPDYSNVLQYTRCSDVPGFPALLTYVLADLGFESRPEYTITIHEFPFNMTEYSAEVKIHTRLSVDGLRLLRFTGRGWTPEYACIDAAYVAITRLRHQYPELENSTFHHFPMRVPDDQITEYTNLAPEDDSEVYHLAWYLRSSDYCLRALRSQLEESRRRLRVLQAAVQPVLLAHGYSLAVLDGAPQVGPPRYFTPSDRHPSPDFPSPTPSREPSPPAPFWRYPTVPPRAGSVPFLPRFF
jgi:hypothetical protein